jgi:hypothetical protein
MVCHRVRISFTYYALQPYVCGECREASGKKQDPKDHLLSRIRHRQWDIDVRVTVHRKYHIRKNQLDATKCWFIDSACFEHYYAHLQEYISEYAFWCPNL